MCVCVYVCMYVCIYIHIYVCVPLYVQIYIYTHIMYNIATLIITILHPNLKQTIKNHATHPRSVYQDWHLLTQRVSPQGVASIPKFKLNPFSWRCKWAYFYGHQVSPKYLINVYLLCLLGYGDPSKRWWNIFTYTVYYMNCNVIYPLVN